MIAADAAGRYTQSHLDVGNRPGGDARQMGFRYAGVAKGEEVSEQGVLDSELARPTDLTFSPLSELAQPSWKIVQQCRSVTAKQSAAGLGDASAHTAAMHGRAPAIKRLLPSQGWKHGRPRREFTNGRHECSMGETTAGFTCLASRPSKRSAGTLVSLLGDFYDFIVGTIAEMALTPSGSTTFGRTNGATALLEPSWVLG